MANSFEGAELPDILDSHDLERLTRTPASTWRFWAISGQGPASFKIGRRRVWAKAVVLRWLAEQEQAAALPADWSSAAAAARRPYPEEKPETEMTSPDEPPDLIDNLFDATEGIDALRTVDFDNEEEGR